MKTSTKVGIVILCTIIPLLMLYVGFMWGKSDMSDIPPNTPVCHAITEDSDITDCSYHNGTWWTE